MELVVVAKSAQAAVIACALAAAGAGCNAVLGLANTTPVDAAVDAYTGPACLVTNMHDEDCDGIPDATDNCPGIANPGQEDVLEVMNGQPADGIGDACDPSPTKTGDRRTRFISFADPNEALEWMVQAGRWVVADDAYLYTGSNSSTPELTVLLAQRPVMPFAANLRVELVDVPAATTETFGVSLDLGATAGCEIQTGASSLLHVTEGGGTSFPVPSGTFAPGTAFTIRGEIVLGVVHCSIDGVVAGTFSNSGTLSNQLGLYGGHGTFRVTYLELYDLSGEP